MTTRKHNERRFGNWNDLPGGGRRYWYDRPGRVYGFQRMIKLVDASEKTLQLIQEIYDDSGRLIERHQKFPFDTGHQRLNEESES